MTRQLERTVRRSRRHRPYQNGKNASKHPKGLMMDGSHPHLWLTQENMDLNFGDLLHSIQRSSSRMKELSIYHICSNLSKGQLAYLVGVIARLPRLEKFALWTTRGLPLPVLTQCLQLAQKLRHVTFQSVQLHSWKEMAQFSNALLQHSHLQSICLDQVQISAPGLTLDPLLHALARNPNLVSVRISADAAVVQDAGCLVRLCTDHLKEFSLAGVELSDAIVDKLAHSLEGPNSLQRLSLRHCGLTVRAQEALIHMLHHNSQLTALHLGNDRNDLPTDLQWWKDFYLSINQTGTRQVLLEDDAVRPSDWLEALVPHNHDLSATFFLLQERGLPLFHS